MIIVDATGSIWIDKDVEVDKGICGTTLPSPFSHPLHSLHSNPVTITNVNALITKHISIIMSYHYSNYKN